MTRLAIGLIWVLSTGLIIDAGYAAQAGAKDNNGENKELPPCCLVGSESPENTDSHPGHIHVGRNHYQLAAVSSEVTSNLGEIGEILLEQRTAVGDRTLPAGRHRVQHIRRENDHAVRFTPIGRIGLMYRPVEVACTLEPLDRRVDRTLVRLRVGDFQLRLLKLYIEGQEAAHVF